MDQIQSDRLTQFAQKYWAPQTAKKHSDFSDEVIEDIYKVDLKTPESNMRRVMMLEFSQYLENYLWPHYNETATAAHTLSIVYMVNSRGLIFSSHIYLRIWASIMFIVAKL